MTQVGLNTKWAIDASHSLLEFSVKHMMIATVKGRFAVIEGVIVADPADLTTAEFEVSADTASIDTRDAGRDEHLRSADFFDAANNPKVSFKSKRVEPTGDTYKIIGDLTMNGVTNEVTFDATLEGQGKDPWGNERLGLSAEAKVNRKDWGLNWNAALEAGGVLVSEQVKIAVQVEAVKQG